MEVDPLDSSPYESVATEAQPPSPKIMKANKASMSTFFISPEI